MFQTKFNSKMTALTVGTGAFLISVIPAFAATDLEEIITSALSAINTLITSIFNPVAIVALGICLVMLIVGKNSKSAETAISWGKRIIVVFVLFNVLGSILEWFTKLTGENRASVD